MFLFSQENSDQENETGSILFLRRVVDPLGDERNKYLKAESISMEIKRVDGIFFLFVIVAGCMQNSEEIDRSGSLDLFEPGPVLLPEEFRDVYRDEEIAIDADINATRFESCTVIVKASAIRITRCEFIETRIFFESVSEIVFADNVVRDYPVPEEPAVSIYGSDRIVLRHNHVLNNSIGISVAESEEITVDANIFEKNYQHNALAIYKSSGEISGNHFTYNFPHGILIHYPPAQGAVSIHENIFFMNVEDAINFENWRDAGSESRVCNNIIEKTAWAGITVEYNSWNARILIEGNEIRGNGYSIEMFPVRYEGWGNGWGHGIKLEDSSGITVNANTILDNDEHGIDIRNCRNAVIRKNTITGNMIGIYISGADPASFTRDVSPLSPKNAGPSQVLLERNRIAMNDENIIEES